MAPSSWKKLKDHELVLLNSLWNFLIAHGKIGIPDIKKASESSHYFVLDLQGSADFHFHKLPDTITLLADLLKHMKRVANTIQGRWNYLGNEKQRLAQQLYWQDIFWKNQTHPTIAQPSEYNYLNQPYLLASDTKFIQDTQVVGSLAFLDEKGSELAQKLSTALPFLSLDPLFLSTLDSAIIADFYCDTLHLKFAVAKAEQNGLNCTIEYELGPTEFTE